MKWAAMAWMTASLSRYFSHSHADLHVRSLPSHGPVPCQCRGAGRPVWPRWGQKPQLGGHDAGQVGHFQGGLRRSAHSWCGSAGGQQLYQLVWMPPRPTSNTARSPSCLMVASTSFGLFHRFLNAGGVDAPVGDELFQAMRATSRQAGSKAGQGDGFRRVVNDQVPPVSVSMARCSGLPGR